MTHADLLLVSVGWLKRRGCHVVLAERGIRGQEPDVIGWKNGLAYVLEVKVSRADFLADKRKPHVGDPNALGRARWYFVPEGIVTPADVPVPWGLIEFNGERCLQRLKPQVLAPSLVSAQRENQLLMSELRAYHAQGITYKVGFDRWPAHPSQ